MKITTIIFFLAISLPIFSQNIVSDTTWIVQDGEQYFQYNQTDYEGGGQDVIKREVFLPRIQASFREKLFGIVTGYKGLYYQSSGIDEKITRLIAEDQMISQLSGSSELSLNQEQIAGGLVGAWNLLDYDRSSTVTITNNNGTLQWGSGNAVVLLPDAIYLQGWRGLGLLLFTEDNNSWYTIDRKISLSR